MLLLPLNMTVCDDLLTVNRKRLSADSCQLITRPNLSSAVVGFAAMRGVAAVLLTLTALTQVTAPAGPP